jgi:hypothetical protein
MQYLAQRILGTLYAVFVALRAPGAHAVKSNLRAHKAMSSLETPTPNRYHDKLTGMFKLQQKSTGLWLDAYEARFF